MADIISPKALASRLNINGKKANSQSPVIDENIERPIKKFMDNMGSNFNGNPSTKRLAKQYQKMIENKTLQKTEALNTI